MGGANFGSEPAVLRRLGFGTPFARMVVCGFLVLGMSMPLAWGDYRQNAGNEKIINI